MLRRWRVTSGTCGGYPYGRNNMLEVAFLASHLFWMTTDADMEALYDMITIDAARAMGVREFGLRVGGAADLVVLTVPSLGEALGMHEASRDVDDEKAGHRPSARVPPAG
ncbi:MAG TPA: amidohydrolase family protein [bacterium]|nr:amidohydrolase family protein [bacterium]